MSTCNRMKYALGDGCSDHPSKGVIKLACEATGRSWKKPQHNGSTRLMVSALLDSSRPGVYISLPIVHTLPYINATEFDNIHYTDHD